MLLHKYTTSAGKDIIFNSRIKVNDPYDFNDPFEHALHLIEATPTDVKRSKFKNKDEMRFVYDNLRKKGMTSGWKDFWHEVSDPAHRDKKAWEVTPDLNRDLKKIFCVLKKGDVTKYFYIACFCSESEKKADEILMWAHYTQGQKGLRFWLDSEILNRRILGEFTKVHYQEHMPIIYAKDVLSRSEKDIMQAHEISLKSKSKVWEYEKEYRWTIHEKFCAFDSEAQGHFVRIDLAAVTRIDFGIKCDIDVENGLVKKISDLGLKIELKKATQDLTDYKINYLDFLK